MYTLEDLIINVTQTLRMPQVTNTDIVRQVNQCYAYVASQVLLTVLESSGVAPTIAGSNIAPIPADWKYHRNLYSCEVENSGSIEVLDSKEQLRRIYKTFETDGRTGPIEYVIIFGQNIFYYPEPTSIVDLTCGYYTRPQVISACTLGYVAPSPLLEVVLYGLQPKILENYVCWQIWSQREDGIEGRKVNTSYHSGQFKEGLDELENSTEVGQSRKLMHRDSCWI